MSKERLLLSSGMFVDGTGATPPRLADVLIEGGRVEAVIDRGTGDQAAPSEADGRPPDLSARALDCSGALVVPGFIDIHTHSDLTWISTPGCDSRVTQGITTEVCGNCGMSPAPNDGADPHFRATISVIDQDPEAPLPFSSFGEYLAELAARRAAVNIAPLVGHGSARQTAIARGGGKAGPKEVASLVAEALRAGAWGTSLGLMYPPGESAGRDELLAVASVTGSSGALLSAHMRDYEGSGLTTSVREVCSLAGATGAHLELSHLRVVRGEGAFVVDRCLELLEAAGPDVHGDAYPYTAGQTTLFQLLTPALRREGVAAFLAARQAERGRYAEAFAAGGFEPSDITVVRVRAGADRASVGRTLATCAAASGLHWSEEAVELLWRSGGYVDVVVVGSRMEEQATILAHPKVMIGSDGFSVSLDYPAAIHPRAFGAFPRALRMLVDGGTTWEQAIAKATSMPAAKAGLDGRGVLRPGAHADIAVIEPDVLDARATYDQPLQPSSGVRHVLTSGVPVLESGRQTGARPGRLLLRG